MNLKEILILSIISIILIGVLFLLLQKFTKDSLPLMDSITFVLSIVAQFLQAQKKIESWVVWFQVNSIYLLMYIDRELYFTFVFYFILWVMSIVGFLDWKKNLQTT